MKNLTVNRLKKLNACPNAIEAFEAQSERDPVKLIREMLKAKQHLDWANWLIVRLMSKRQAVRYAVYAAEQVLDIFEKERPDDKRPREAIRVARTWLKRPTKKNRDAAHASSAAHAASASADASHAACAAAHDAARAAARAASAAAAAAARAASRAAYYASYAASAAAWAAAYADQDVMLVKFLKYGLKLLMEDKKT